MAAMIPDKANEHPSASTASFSLPRGARGSPAPEIAVHDATEAPSGDMTDLDVFFHRDTEAYKDWLESGRGISWYKGGPRPQSPESAPQEPDNYIFGISGLSRTELGEIEGVNLETSNGTVLLDTKTAENLLVVLFEFKEILADETEAPYDCLWTRYIEDLEHRLPADQYTKFCELFKSPSMPALCVGVEMTNSVRPSGPLSPAALSYQPLSQGEIRLLIVLPQQDSSAAVDCILCHERLENQPEYEALSYVWGDASKTRRIRVNGLDFAATENLEDALRSLRYTDPGKFRVLWVDAICINQSSIPERNEQVRRMYEVYASAQCVCVWLGREANTDRLAVEFLRCLPKLLLGAEMPAHDINVGQRVALTDVQAVLHTVQHPSFAGCWEALGNLFSRPWWSRVWVIQEVLLARRTVMYCGRLEVDWDIHSATISLLLGNPVAVISAMGHSDTTAPVKNSLRFLNRAYTIVAMQKVLGYRESAEKMLSLLNNARRGKATDARDHVYGIMGLLRQDMVIAPDYNLSLQMTFTRTAVLHMKNTHTLDVLSYVFHYMPPPARMLLLPSWVPDWRYPTSTMNPGQFGQVHLGSLFRASSDRKSPFPFYFFTETMREVGLLGFTVDTIEEVGPVATQYRPSAAIRDWRQHIGDRVAESYFGLHSTLEAFWRTVSCDIMITRQEFGRIGGSVAGIATLPPSEAEEDLLYAYHDMQIDGMVPRRRFFRTRTGRMGLGAAGTKPGDIVVVLLGGSAPFILRRAMKGRHFLICDSYVHGIMDGEIAEEWKSSKRSLEWFVLV